MGTDWVVAVPLESLLDGAFCGDRGDDRGEQPVVSVLLQESALVSRDDEPDPGVHAELVE